MKPLLLIPVVMFSACVTQAPPKPAIRSTPPPNRAVSGASRRTGEQVREYRFGRYPDPGDPRVMHESHPVYRVETTAGWNLSPTASAAPASRSKKLVPAALPNDAAVAEVNKQRAATRAVTEQAAILNQRLGEMTQATAQTQELAKHMLSLKREIAAVRERLDASETQPRERKPATVNDSATRAEDRW